MGLIMNLLNASHKKNRWFMKQKNPKEQATIVFFHGIDGSTKRTVFNLPQK